MPFKKEDKLILTSKSEQNISLLEKDFYKNSKETKGFKKLKKIEKTNTLNCEMVLNAPSKEAIDNYIQLISKTIGKDNMTIFWLPKKKSKITLLKSPHVNKRAKEHFEMNNYKAKITFLSNDSFTQRNSMFLQKPAFVQIKTIWSVSNL